ncbi:phospholipase D-like domain-containing protein [Sandarakinorhabdus sp.]|uniref:phospholipase D-like domain-containing protein n=1 Tax=Sandarakinorhabdus sp. TaxID=1916663 RepID=UPI003F715347
MAIELLIAVLVAVPVALLAFVLWLQRPWPGDGGEYGGVIGPATQGPLADLLAPALAAHDDSSGVRLLDDPTQAMAMRLLLIAQASQSIDAQYYIIKDDEAGHLFLDRLAEAAARGVAVRLLVDDHGTGAMDGRLAALDAVPGVQVRIFNPFRLRRVRKLNLVLNFTRLHRRMHNKCLCVDGLAAVVGGRNIGEDYFDVNSPTLMADQDVLAVGPIVGDVEAMFADYWNSDVVRPLGEPVPGSPRVGQVPTGPCRRVWEDAAADPQTAALIDHPDDFEWTRVQLFSDPPEKTLGEAETSALILPRLLEVIAPIERRVQLVSAYLVPPSRQVEAFADLVGKGVRIDILTNSFTSNDVVLAHVWYAPWRRPLLRAGVSLWELRGKEGKRASLGLVPQRLRRRNTGPNSSSFFRASANGLHAKLFVVDGRWLFVGSMNFDERSLRINTEMGFLIKSQRLAAHVSDGLDERLPRIAWAVCEQDGALVWREGDRLLHPEPGTNAARRVAVWLLGKLPLGHLF